MNREADMSANNFIAGWRWILVLILAIGVGLAAKGHSVSSATEPAITQDAFNLSQRINSLEQRLVMIESSVRRIEQQQMSMSRQPMPTQTGRDPEVDRLRSQFELFNLRLRELECGLAHLDERTLSATMKEARRRAGTEAQDACRLNPETPIKLSIRQ
jgi:hypothetical protein